MIPEEKKNPLGSYVVNTCKRSWAHALGASEVWHLSFLLMNSFNKTEAAILSIHAMLPKDFPITQIILPNDSFF